MSTDDFDRLAQELIKKFPDMPEELQKELPDYLRACRRRKESKRILKISRAFAEYYREKTYLQFLWKLERLNKRPPESRKRGRPKSKKTTAEFIKENFLFWFDNYVGFALRALTEKQFDLGQIQGSRLPLIDLDFYQVWKKYVVVEGESGNAEPTNGISSIDFNIAAWFTLLILRGIVLEVLLNNLNEIIGVSDKIKSHLQEYHRSVPILQNLGFSQEFIDSLGKDVSKALPNDMLRKVRKPKYPQNKIVTLTRVIKEWNGLPYVDEVAAKLKVSESTLAEMIQEANRMRRPIAVGKDSNGKEFLMVG